MAVITGPFFADIARVGQADSGEIVYITVCGTDGNTQPVLFSYKMVPKLITAILAGAKLAAQARIEEVGSEAAADAMLGVQGPKVRSIEVGMAKNGRGIDLVLHLDLQGEASFDVALPPKLAAQLAKGLRQTATKAEVLRRLKPN